jgi:acyl carrier protein
MLSVEVRQRPSPAAETNLVTIETIVDAISTVVRRYAGLRNPSEKTIEVTAKTRPYSDLGMDSLHDVNIACEVEILLGVHLPPEEKILATENRALSISQAAHNIAKRLGVMQ